MRLYRYFCSPCCISRARQLQQGRRRAGTWVHGRKGHCDVVIAGGGIMGCASAYFLAQRMPPGSICVVERDPTYERASSALSVSSIRQQFSEKGNVLMSLYSAHFLKNASTLLQVEGDDPPDPQFFEGGYLFLASPQGEGILRENFAVQTAAGAAMELLEPAELRRRYPWLNTDGIQLGCLGVKNEGWFDPWLLLTALKKKAMSLGVRFLEAEVTGVHVEQNRVKRVKLRRNYSEAAEEDLSCTYLVNTTGPWAADLALMAGVGDRTEPNPVLHVPLPVSPRKRCVFVFQCPGGPEEGACPLVVDPTGTYFRGESRRGMFLAGVCPPEHLDVDGAELEVDYSLFEQNIWPVIAHRVPAFESLKVQSAWAGYYEYNTLDQNAIIGAHPVITNFILANGFSGHGVQQAPAAGRAVSEVILDGRTHSIDLSGFGFERIVENRPLVERNVV